MAWPMFSKPLARLARARGVRLVLAGVVLGAAMQARADVWAYVDTQGVAHFSSEQVDARYELFFRQAETFDTQLDPPAPERAANQGIALDPPPPPAKLLAFFDSSPSYKSVRQILQDASSDHNIDYELLQALIATESGFNSTAVSPKGAIGLMQLMPDTARRYGVSTDRHGALERKLTDPRTNVRAGVRYLRDLINMFPGELELALAAYNAGEGAVMRAGNRIPNYKETQSYVKNVMALYAGLKPPLPPAATSPESRYPHSRVRPAIRGGALNRGNLPAQTPAAPLPSGLPTASN
ncbi:MAG: lytic transglycosylase domain-containing protein [Burkholderiaceae bacterium]